VQEQQRQQREQRRERRLQEHTELWFQLLPNFVPGWENGWFIRDGQDESSNALRLRRCPLVKSTLSGSKIISPISWFPLKRGKGLTYPFLSVLDALARFFAEHFADILECFAYLIQMYPNNSHQKMGIFHDFPSRMVIWLVVWNIFFLIFHILGMSSSQLTFIFFRGVGTVYHQPVI